VRIKIISLVIYESVQFSKAAFVLRFQGVYTLADSDGTKRIVQYADEGHGFTAHVQKEGIPVPDPAPSHEGAAYTTSGVGYGVGVPALGAGHAGYGASPNGEGPSGGPGFGAGYAGHY
jgi:hypothetical protein